MKIAKIIQKNLKLLMRSKGSIITTLVGPLVIILLVGLAFGNITSYSINVGVYSPQYNELTESFIGKLENQSFKITKFPLKDLCINEIKKGTVHTCIFFPNNFKAASNRSSTIEFYVDETNVNVVSMVKEAVSKQVQSRMQELSEDLTQNMLQKIEDVTASSKEQVQLITSLIDDSSSISSKVSSVENDLASMDIDFNKNDLELDDIDDGLEDTQTDLISLNAEAESAIDRALDLISDIRGLSPTPEMVTELDDAEDDLEGYESSVNSSYSSADTEVASLLSKVSNISTNLNSISNRINTADATRNTIRDNVDLIEENIESLQQELNSLKDKVETMSGNVENIDVADAQGIVKPIKTLIKPVVAEKAPMHYMLPSLIILVIMFISMMLAGTLVVMEKSSSAFFRNFVTPTSDVTFLYGTFFTNVIVVGLQMILVLGASYAVFEASILSNFLSVLIVIFLSIAVYTVIGMIIGYIFTTQEMVSLGGITVGSLFLLMSNMIFPLEKMPSSMVQLAQYNPFILSESLLRKAILFNTEIIYLMSDMFLLIFIIISLFVVLVGIEKLGRRIFLTGVHFIKHKKYSTLDKDKLEEIKRGERLEESDKKGEEKKEDIAMDDMTQDEEEKKDYDEMDSPKHTGFFSFLFKKTSQTFEEPRLIKEKVEEFVEDEQKKKKKSNESKKPSKGKEEPRESKVKGILSKLSKKEKPEQTNPLLAKLEPHQYFVLSSGNIVKSFKDLITMLEKMDDETFQYHVGKDKNDFYLWVKNVLKADNVAAKIEKIKDKKQMVRALKKFL